MGIHPNTTAPAHSVPGLAHIPYLGLFLLRGRFFGRFRVLFRNRRPSHPHLAQIYAEEAARLRNLAVSVTTAPLRSRLLKDADHQERLAQAIKPSVHRPMIAWDADFIVTGERR